MYSSHPDIPAASRGRLKIYLGYAAGVGKTYQMLEEARELQARGVDVILGFLEPHGRDDIAELAQDLQRIPLLSVVNRTAVAYEMDVDEILRRRPQVCLVDEIAHANAPGSTRQKRWEDIEALLDSGIDVLTTMNVQDLSSLGDEVWRLTGLRIRETVPDWVFQQANEVVMVDVTPRALRHRLERGAIYAGSETAVDSEQLFEEGTLVALRELAIRQVAQSLEARKAAEKDRLPKDEQRILVNITADPSSAMLLRRARRVADFLDATCAAVCVYSTPRFSDLPAAEREAIERHLRFAQGLRIESRAIHGSNRARTLLEYAHNNGFNRVFLSQNGHAAKSLILFHRDFTGDFINLARDLDITIVARRNADGRIASPYPEDEAASCMHAGFVRVSPDLSVEEASAEIRRQAGQLEMIYYAYALDDSDRLLGVVSFRELLSVETKKVRDVMRTDFLSVSEDTDKAEVAQLLATNRLLAVPVLDSNRRMKGIVTSADLAGLVQQKASEDFQKIGGMEALEGPYLKVGFGQMIRKRAGWLAILFVGEMLTATAMGYFSDEISRAVVLALFLPLIISSGGNSGSQATTLVIRAMAVGELRLRDWWRVISRELVTGLALGAILGAIGITRIIAWHIVRGTYGPHYPVIAFTIGCSLIGVVLFGTIAGSMLPFLLRRCGLDPASASAPFVATLVDVTGLIIYFSIANIILKGTLL